MTTHRHVVLGLAHVRSGWFTDVARWSTAGTVPVEFVKCLSAAEVRTRAASGRRISAALLDVGLAAVDRDLIHELTQRSIAVVLVDHPQRQADATTLGAAATLPAAFDRSALMQALDTHANTVPDPASPDSIFAGARPTADPGTSLAGTDAPPRPLAPLITVVGRSGSGASTMAIAVAQFLADANPNHSAPVVLADLARHAHHALLHDAGDIIPGLPELADTHRRGGVGTSLLNELTFQVPQRGYRLLLGLRHHHDWVQLRPRSIRGALDGLRAATNWVVADISADLEGEHDTGSFDVEDRHSLSRVAVASSALVVVVALPTLTGLHAAVVLLGDLERAGVARDRVLVVVNRAPSRPRRRAELVRVMATLADAPAIGPGYHGPVFVPERRSIEDRHATVARMPGSVTSPVGRAVVRLVNGLGSQPPGTGGEVPVRLVPGELGTAGDDS